MKNKVRKVLIMLCGLGCLWCLGAMQDGPLWLGGIALAAEAVGLVLMMRGDG